MPDREKIIKGLELCTNISQDGCLMLCPYKDEKDETYSGFCEQVLKQDALTLLKEQEAKVGEWITIWREDDPDTSSSARCSICNRISERPLGLYCKWCGAKMSQEWGVDG